MLNVQSLRITEIFYSIQGESNSVGWPTVFVRLTGCPLRCQYCDTAYAFHGGQSHTITEILQQIAQYTPRYVCVTGGEPLAQRDCLTLLTHLCDQGYQVSLETSGALDISGVDPRVIKVLDLKTPGSGECKRNLWSNLTFLLPHDQIKLVICDYADYEWAKQVIIEQSLISKAQILFSPSYQQIEPQQLAEWILRDRLPVRLQIQLHKTIWGDIPGK
jgi:7-carboxy-7-deazaguanine synthase